MQDRQLVSGDDYRNIVEGDGRGCRGDLFWEIDARMVIDQKLAGVYPLLPLMRWEGASDADIIETSQRLVLEGSPSHEEQADASAALQVLSRIRFPADVVRPLLRRNEMRLESPVYQEWMEEGRIAGLREGKELGIEEGKELGLQESVLEAVEVRFEAVPPEVERKVHRIRGRKTLERLLRISIVAESLEAFQESLSEIRAS